MQSSRYLKRNRTPEMRSELIRGEKFSRRLSLSLSFRVLFEAQNFASSLKAANRLRDERERLRITFARRRPIVVSSEIFLPKNPRRIPVQQSRRSRRISVSRGD